MYLPKLQAIYEMMAFWLGGVTAAEFGRVVGLTREHVQREFLPAYRREFGNATVLDTRSKRTRFDGDSFDLNCAPNTVSDIYAALAGLDAFARGAGEQEAIALSVPIEDTMAASHRADASEEYRRFIGAIARREVLSIEYAAKGGVRAFEFSPHVLVRTAFRIHVRGAAVVSGLETKFIDLVPARALNIENAGSRGYVSRSADRDWSTIVYLEAKLAEGLDDHIKDALRREFRLEEESLIVKTRMALVDYVKDELLARRVYGQTSPVWTVVSRKYSN